MNNLQTNRRVYSSVTSCDDTMIFDGDSPLTADEIPSTINYLIIRSNQPIYENTIPPSVRNLSFCGNFNQPLCQGVLPSTINWLSTSTSKSIYIPSSVKKLWCHLQILANLVIEPDTNFDIIQLSASDENIKVGDICVPVKHLHLFFSSRAPLTKNCIPHGVSRLTLNNNFNQNLCRDIIPLSVKHLTVGERFRSEIEIDPDIKIGCQSNNYEMFLKKNFRHVYFETGHRHILRKFSTQSDSELSNIKPNSEHFVFEDSLYLISLKPTKYGKIRVTLKLDMYQPKSSRKI